MKKRSLLGLHFNPETKPKNNQEEEKVTNTMMGHSIDPEKMEFEEYNIACESQGVIFPT